MSPGPTLVVIQSRLASTRLPAKALLPIGGLPAVLLCARRAANTGLRVVVATSDESTDDPIADLLAAEGIACFRGSHDDVLDRFARATDLLPDDAVVVRLTADNVFPDGVFIGGLVKEFALRDLDYLGTASPQDGLPYGLSAEAISARALRRAHAEATAADEREHVTLWIRRHSRVARYTLAERQPNWSRLRCTLDTFDDYRMLSRVFSSIGDPVSAPWATLVDRLAAETPNGHEPRCTFRDTKDGRTRSVLALGTVQFGLPYGIANRTGLPGDAELAGLLVDAVDAGITSLDTARAYGLAEQRIGRLLPPGYRERVEIVTKLDVLQDLPADAPAKCVQSAIDASVFRSAHALRTQRIDVLLLHRWEHRHAWNGAAWKALAELKRAGVIGVLGASVANPTEAIAALADPEVGHLQCPVNLLDAKWRSDDFLVAVQSRPDVVVHARSALLQGLLTLPASEWVRVPGVDAVRLCDTLDTLVRDLGRPDRADLCLSYVRSLPWVDSVVVGMETRSQLHTNLATARSAPLSIEDVKTLVDRIPHLPESLLNPSLWKAGHV